MWGKYQVKLFFKCSNWVVVRNTSIEDNLEEPLELSSFKPYQIGQRCSTFRTNGMVEVPQAQPFDHRKRHANVQESDGGAVSTACSEEEYRAVTRRDNSLSQSEKWKWKLLSCVQLFVILWTIQSMEFSRQEYWSGYPFPSPGDLPNPGIESRDGTQVSRIAGGFFISWATREASLSMLLSKLFINTEASLSVYPFSENWLSGEGRGKFFCPLKLLNRRVMRWLWNKLKNLKGGEFYTCWRSFLPALLSPSESAVRMECTAHYFHLINDCCTTKAMA